MPQLTRLSHLSRVVQSERQHAAAVAFGEAFQERTSTPRLSLAKSARGEDQEVSMLQPEHWQMKGKKKDKEGSKGDELRPQIGRSETLEPTEPGESELLRPERSTKAGPPSSACIPSCCLDSVQSEALQDG